MVRRMGKGTAEFLVRRLNWAVTSGVYEPSDITHYCVCDCSLLPEVERTGQQYILLKSWAILVAQYSWMT